jgi:ubiquinone/menaquinone biosynthesis C-methylase UbiE/uncharacterized protein YbaR (Trm112 family)
MSKLLGKEFLEILACPKCKSRFSKKSNLLICSKGHKYKLNRGVPVMADLDPYLEIEAKAWEDEWKKGVKKGALNAYNQNMQIFRKLGFWEESGEAAGFIPSQKDFRVLDLGCGNGVSSAHIKGKLVVGMDLSERQMVRAKERFKNKNFVVGDARKLPFKNNTFDLVVAINLLHHIDESNDVLKESYRVLRKGGKLLTVDPNLYNPVGYLGRGTFRLLHLKSIFPTFPQFALGEDERQFTKKQYYSMFKKSPFKNYKIIPHRIERLLFFATILIPSLSKIPGYNPLLYWVSRIGNSIVKVDPFDNICYFWIGDAEK